jgi:hypothetical protein
MLNSVVSNCGPDASTACVYSQSPDFTPFLNHTVVFDHASGNLTLVGQRLTSPLAEELLGGVPYGLQVWVGAIECTVVEITTSETSEEQTVHLTTPPLTAGVNVISASVMGYGRAQSLATLTLESEVTAVIPTTAIASLAGGTPVTMQGTGFSHVCSENDVTVSFRGTVADSPLLIVPVSELLACTPTGLDVLLPSLLPRLDAHAQRYSGLVWDLTEADVVVNNATSTKLNVTADTLHYSSVGTPLVVVNATEGHENSVLMFTIFTGLDVSSGDVSVTIGGKPCITLDTHNTDDEAGVPDESYRHTMTRYCAAPALPARVAAYPILVNVDPLGYALTNSSAGMAVPMYQSLFHADVLAPRMLNSSARGGIDLTVSGYGFSESVSVQVCEQNCTAVAGTTSYYSVHCIIPERLTTAVIDDIADRDLQVDRIQTIAGTYFSSLNAPASPLLANTQDGDFATYFEHGSLTCSVGVRLPAGYKAQPYRMRFYPRYKYSTNINNFVFEGSTDGGTTFTTIASSSKAHEGWNFVTAPADKATNWYNAFRYRAADTSSFSRCFLAEVEFTGTVAATQSTCPITVTSPDADITTVIGSVSYGDISQFTPLITEISPNNGTALGGTLVTITGHHFDAFPSLDNHHAVSVSFSGVACTVQSTTATQITCITNPRRPEDVEISSVVVNIPGRGVAVVGDDVSYLYIDNWSELTSWKNQELPVEGDFVWIPDGQVLSLDIKTPILTFLLVEGSLYFDRNKDVSLDSSYIFVFGGYMEVGTEEQPFEKSAVITLHGGRYTTIEIPFVGSKVLAVAAKGLPRAEFMTGEHLPGRHQGQLEIHGSKRLRTWTKLDVTAEAGQMHLVTAEPVDFKNGEIVIVTGSERPNGDEAGGDDFTLYGMEELTVDFVSADGYNVTFTTPLRFTHRSEIVTIEGRTIDMRVEIGLLSRNVIIQGDDYFSDSELFGVHTIAFLSGIYHMENAEIRRCGQAFNFGRYCTHSHMAGDMRGSYVKANSIHHSYQRAVTTHDTNNWEVVTVPTVTSFSPSRSDSIACAKLSIPFLFTM